MPCARAIAALLLTALPSTIRAQQCVSHRGESSFGHLQGLRVDSVAVESASPSVAEPLAAITNRLHVRTSPATIRRMFNQRAGTAIDTLKLKESLRLLRRAHILADAQLDARECPDDGRVTLTLRTMDAWSVRGGVRLGRTRSVASVGEDNLFGRGRSIRTNLRLDEGQPGFGVRYVDPWFVGSPFSLAVGRTQYHGGSETSMMLESSSPRADDPWRMELGGSRGSRQSLAAVGDRVERLTWRGSVGRRVLIDENAAVSLQLGAERVAASLSSAPAAMLVGPSRVTRDVSGVLIGVARRSLAVVPRPMLVGRSDPVDLPAALEFDATVTVGRDAVSGAPTRHVDAWAGKLWPVGRSALLSASGWWSGFHTPTGWSAGDARTTLLAVVPDRRGQWSARIASEVLLDPDPDVRALVSFDPTARLLPSRGLAEAATLLSLDRAWRVGRLTRGYDLGGAVFTAASRRWDLASGSASGSRDLALVGVGLRLLPARVAHATLRLDLAMPFGVPAVPHRPILSFSISPWLEHERHRDGRPTP